MTPDALLLRDEVLQVLYWREGEGLGVAASVADLRVLLPNPEPELVAIVDALVVDALVVDALIEPLVPGAPPQPARYRLTALGKREGGRRFADAFVDHGLGGAHGTCGPGCEDCLTEGPEHCSAHDHAGHDHHDH